MWNLLKYVPDVFVELKARGFDFECTVATFRTELKRATGVMTDKTIGKWMRSLQELGYIKLKNDKVLELCEDFEHPYIFGSGNALEVVQPLSTPELDEEMKNIKKAKIIHEK